MKPSYRGNTLADGSRFQGLVDKPQNGIDTSAEPQGYGDHFGSDGTRVFGQFRSGVRDGWCMAFHPNGDRYIGFTQNGKRHGYGALISANGDELVGTWKSDKMEGRGTQTIKSLAATYVGGWKDGMRDGLGTLTVQNAKYTGSFSKGRFHSWGTLALPDGCTYDGEWRDGIQHGRGTFTKGDQTLESAWIMGRIAGNYPALATRYLRPKLPESAKASSQVRDEEPVVVANEKSPMIPSDASPVSSLSLSTISDETNVTPALIDAVLVPTEPTTVSQDSPQEPLVNTDQQPTIPEIPADTVNSEQTFAAPPSPPPPLPQSSSSDKPPVIGAVADGPDVHSSVLVDCQHMHMRIPFAEELFNTSAAPRKQDISPVLSDLELAKVAAVTDPVLLPHLLKLSAFFGVFGLNEAAAALGLQDPSAVLIQLEKQKFISFVTTSRPQPSASTLPTGAAGTPAPSPPTRFMVTPLGHRLMCLLACRDQGDEFTHCTAEVLCGPLWDYFERLWAPAVLKKAESGSILEALHHYSLVAHTLEACAVTSCVMGSNLTGVANLFSMLWQPILQLRMNPYVVWFITSACLNKTENGRPTLSDLNLRALMMVAQLHAHTALSIPVTSQTKEAAAFYSKSVGALNTSIRSALLEAIARAENVSKGAASDVALTLSLTQSSSANQKETKQAQTSALTPTATPSPAPAPSAGPASPRATASSGAAAPQTGHQTSTGSSGAASVGSTESCELVVAVYVVDDVLRKPNNFTTRSKDVFLRLSSGAAFSLDSEPVRVTLPQNRAEFNVGFVVPFVWRDRLGEPFKLQLLSKSRGVDQVLGDVSLPLSEAFSSADLLSSPPAQAPVQRRLLCGPTSLRPKKAKKQPSETGSARSIRHSAVLEYSCYVQSRRAWSTLLESRGDDDLLAPSAKFSTPPRPLSESEKLLKQMMEQARTAGSGTRRGTERTADKVAAVTQPSGASTTDNIASRVVSPASSAQTRSLSAPSRQPQAPALSFASKLASAQRHSVSFAPDTVPTQGGPSSAPSQPPQPTPPPPPPVEMEEVMIPLTPGITIKRKVPSIRLSSPPVLSVAAIQPPKPQPVIEQPQQVAEPRPVDPFAPPQPLPSARQPVPAHQFDTTRAQSNISAVRSGTAKTHVRPSVLGVFGDLQPPTSTPTSPVTVSAALPQPSLGDYRPKPAGDKQKSGPRVEKISPVGKSAAPSATGRYVLHMNVYKVFGMLTAGVAQGDPIEVEVSVGHRSRLSKPVLASCVGYEAIFQASLKPKVLSVTAREDGRPNVRIAVYCKSQMIGYVNVPLSNVMDSAPLGPQYYALYTPTKDEKSLLQPACAILIDLTATEVGGAPPVLVPATHLPQSTNGNHIARLITDPFERFWQDAMCQIATASVPRFPAAPPPAAGQLSSPLASPRSKTPVVAPIDAKTQLWAKRASLQLAWRDILASVHGSGRETAKATASVLHACVEHASSTQSLAFLADCLSVHNARMLLYPVPADKTSEMLRGEMEGLCSLLDLKSHLCLFNVLAAQAMAGAAEKSQQALQCAWQALVLSHEIHNTQFESQALSVIAHCLASLNYPQRALGVLQTAISVSEHLRHSRRAALLSCSEALLLNRCSAPIGSQLTPLSYALSSAPKSDVLVRNIVARALLVALPPPFAGSQVVESDTKAADALLQNGELARAIISLTSALDTAKASKQSSAIVECAVRLCQAYQRAGDYPRALSALTTGVPEPQPAVLHYHIGKLHASFGHSLLAYQAFSSFLAASSGANIGLEAVACVSMAELCRAEGHALAAIRLFEQAIANGTQSSEGHFEALKAIDALSTILLSVGQTESAISLLLFAASLLEDASERQLDDGWTQLASKLQIQLSSLVVGRENASSMLSEEDSQPTPGQTTSQKLGSSVFEIPAAVIDPRTELSIEEIIGDTPESESASCSLASFSVLPHHVYVCLTCLPDHSEDSLICESCIKKCHSGHLVMEQPFAPVSCACGSGMCPMACSCLSSTAVSLDIVI